MTCREFKAQLHEYLEESLAGAQQAAARAHVEECKECRLAVAQAQQFGRALHHALHRSAATVSLEAEFSQRLLQTAASRMRDSAARRAWHWLTASPFRTVGAAAFVGVVLFTLLLSRPTVKAPGQTRQTSDDRILFSIDVPFQTDRHIGVTHAEFSAPLKP